MTAFKRTLSLQTTIAIVIGGVIGSGIFMKPALMASQLGSPVLLLSVWVVAGLITLFGALSNAELASMFPQTGGQFVFFQKIYGKGFAFLYGWAAFAVFNTGGNASIAYVCSQYTNYFVALPRFSVSVEHSWVIHLPYIGDLFPLENFGVKTLTILIILVLTFISYRSVQYGSRLQRILTLLKVVAIVLLVAGVFGSGKGSMQHLSQTLPSAPHGWKLVAAYMAAIAGAFWAYDGWNNITFVAGEIKEPQKNIPKSLFAGLLFCIFIYASINLVYIYALPIDALASSSFVASDAALVAWGTLGGSIIALIVILSTAGTTNANVLATARVTFAMGKDNRMFRWAGKVHPNYNTPGNALWLNAAWTVVLILSGSFDMLTDMLIFVSWFFYGMSALGVLILRKKMKDTPRAYRVSGYPVVPVVFVAFTAFFLGTTLVNDIQNYRQDLTPVINALLGILITCIGIPVYLFSGKKNAPVLPD
ncbi:amino acid permease [Sediminibacterium roseum]|uniref:Amino acid permease n=1 Tax=Sediminibacterium roseum TaxID=1978412 RepID=A0ABW9ZUM1_9BACT|nr:amino acid permease [Sediminibacterium roseum]NCI48770.1 amino acid permease [Sediminibacterium roseum]